MSAADLETRVVLMERKLAVLADREAIRDIIYRYCRAVDRADNVLLKSCYWPDGFDDHGFFGGNAHDFAEYVCTLLRATASTTHSCSNPSIEFDGDRAFCETQGDVIHRHVEDSDQVYEWVQCRYLDVFERRAGEWRILVRTLTFDGIHWLKLANLPELFSVRGLPPENVTLRGARSPDDPVYRLSALRDLVRERIPVSEFWSGLGKLARKL